MRLSIFSLFFLYCLLVITNPIFSQNSSQNINSKQQTYTILKGEGLYRISLKLGTTIDELIRLNPALQQGFSEGQVILIPTSNAKNISGSNKITSPSDDDKYIIHTVEKGQTLYSLSLKYDIPIEVIVQNNPGVENGLIEGNSIKIPKDTQVNLAEKQRSSDYTYHTIEARETLYGISKTFNCSVEDILDSNPGLSIQTMKVGNEIRIPKNGRTKIAQSEAANSTHDIRKETVYIIKKRDKLTSIAKEFFVTETEIKNLNPTIDFNNLKVGNQIIVPTQSSSIDRTPVVDVPNEEMILEQDSKSKCSGFNYQLTPVVFKIAILLPFAATDNLSPMSGEGTSTPLSSVSKIFLEYYEGALLALDKLKKEGVKVECFVYDTWPDSSKIRQIIAKPEFKKMNLIFGPAYAVNLSLVSDFAKQNKIPLVYPLSSKNFELAENPYIFQINSSDTVVYDNVGRYFASQKGARIIAVTSQIPSMKEREVLAKVKDSFKKAGSSDNTVFVEVPFTPENGFDKLLSSLVSDKNNLIYIPSEKESDVSLIVNAVHGILKKTSSSISIIGMPEWLKYSSVNAEDIHASNTYIFTRSALDYYDIPTQTFIKEYRLLFKSEPVAFSPYFQYGGKNPNYSRYGILGYDLTYYFVSALREFGPQFQYCLKGFQPATIQSNFSFKRIGNWGGFYDDGLFLVHFRPDYKIERIRLH